MRRKRKKSIRRTLILLFLVIAIMGVTALSIYYSNSSQQTMITQSYYETEHTVTINQPLTIIDAGHGGINPRSDSQGILEKEINLEIALKLQEVLHENG